ncbi:MULTISPECIES: DUF6629 family protein [Rhodanobacter]|uniref:DUF6629 family protein n=1 Tax=Rhodanobacter TaxID=75309 RepID=UPI001F3A1275|nr:DUF6629 family protein [Rhodanobacter thiooxydans]UJJ53535.1 hypothetical protein LRK53_11115 [Rhodanobacter thiooxydans]
MTRRLPRGRCPGTGTHDTRIDTKLVFPTLSRPWRAPPGAGEVRLDGDRLSALQPHDPRLFARLLAQGSLRLSEAYMDGWWDVPHVSGRLRRPALNHFQEPPRMCFSATASFTASAALAGIGLLGLRRVPDRRYRLLAWIPLLFAAQQFTEGLVWMSYPWAAPGLRGVATQVYSVFSHLLWPVYVPWAVRAIEPGTQRRRWLGLLAMGGLASAAFLAWGMVATPIHVAPVGGHLEYASPHFFLPLSLTLYLAATTLSLAISSRPLVQVFGLLAMISAAVAYAVYARWFISVWCFYAAAVSLIVYIALRHADAAERVTSTDG